MTDAAALPDPRLVGLVATWKLACDDFVALVRSLSEEQGDLPTDLAGWNVRDNVAHTAHLEAVIAGAPEETIEVAPAPHLDRPMSFYTEQGVLARRGRTLAELADELEGAVTSRHAALAAHPPTDGDAAPPKTPGDIGWSWATLLNNRPLDVFMHDQDVRRAVDRPGGYDGPVADHVLVVFGRALPMVWGKRVGAPVGTSARVTLTDLPHSWTVLVGDDGRAAPAEVDDPTVTLSLSAEDYVVLSGGRRAAASAHVEGDQELGAKLLAFLAVTP